MFFISYNALSQYLIPLHTSANTVNTLSNSNYKSTIIVGQNVKTTKPISMKRILKLIILLIMLAKLTTLQAAAYMQPTAVEDSAEVHKAHALLAAVIEADRFITKLDSLYTIDLPVGIKINDSKDAENTYEYENTN